MGKFLVVYERGFWFFKNEVGMELVEAESWEKAYEKLSLRFSLKFMRQVNDDSKPQDFRRTSIWQIEEENRHEEAMALNSKKEKQGNEVTKQ